MKNNNSEKQSNYLDFVPIKNANIESKTDESGNVVLVVENRGVFNRIAQLIFKKPKHSMIHLEEMGSFIWPLIDGNNTIYDIADKVKEHFGEKAEPLYNRLVQYVKIMENYDFIKVQKSDGAK